jgi:hypothetical protein
MAQVNPKNVVFAKRNINELIVTKPVNTVKVTSKIKSIKVKS